MTAADVTIIGRGPAGLSDALMLGRCRRSVLVGDASHDVQFVVVAAAEDATAAVANNQPFQAEAGHLLPGSGIPSPWPPTRRS